LVTKPQPEYEPAPTKPAGTRHQIQLPKVLRAHQPDGPDSDHKLDGTFHGKFNRQLKLLKPARDSHLATILKLILCGLKPDINTNIIKPHKRTPNFRKFRMDSPLSPVLSREHLVGSANRCVDHSPDLRFGAAPGDGHPNTTNGPSEGPLSLTRVLLPWTSSATPPSYTRQMVFQTLASHPWQPLNPSSAPSSTPTTRFPTSLIYRPQAMPTCFICWRDRSPIHI
jgi:hypothetical protein